jgi:hypothetical protein
MVADDAAARKLLEEDLQAEAMLKEFSKGNPVRLFPDSDANQLAMQNMMSPGCRVTKSFYAKGEKKVNGASQEEEQCSWACIAYF